MHIYKYVQSHIIIILHRHILVTPVTINNVSSNMNKINIQITVSKCIIKPLGGTLDFLKHFVWT